MSLSSDRSTVARIQKEINELQRKQADEMKKVAHATKSMNSAMASASRATSPSSAKSYLSTAEREAKNVESAQDRAARHSADISRKMDDLSRAQARVLTGEEKERRDQAAAYDKQRKTDAMVRKKLQSDNVVLFRDLASLKSQLTAAIEAQAESTQPFVVESAEGRVAHTTFSYLMHQPTKRTSLTAWSMVPAQRGSTYGMIQRASPRQQSERAYCQSSAHGEAF